MKPYLIPGWICIQTTHCLYFNYFSILKKKCREVLQENGTVFLFTNYLSVGYTKNFESLAS